MNSHIYNLQERTECNKVEPKLRLWVINYEIIGRAKGTAVVKAKNAQEAADILVADSDFNACREDFKISRIEEILTTGAFSGLLMEEYVRKENSFTDNTVLIKLSDNTVSTEKIIDGAVTKDKISKELQLDINDVVNKISPGSITDKHIAKNAIMTNHLQNIAVTSDKILDGAITETKIATNNIDSKHLKNQCIKSTHLSNECVRHINNTINSVISSRKYGFPLPENDPNPVVLGIESEGGRKIYQRVFARSNENRTSDFKLYTIGAEDLVYSISGQYVYGDYNGMFFKSGIIDVTKISINEEGEIYIDCSEFLKDNVDYVNFHIMMTYVQ